MKFLTGLIAILLTLTGWSQNRINYSQYMHNQGIFNPAFFSSQQDLTATVYYRNQWVGIEGAPTTKSFVGSVSFANQHTINLNLYQDDITIFRDSKIGLGYNYRLNLSESAQLAFGVNGDYGVFTANYQSLHVTHIDDETFSQNQGSRAYLNIGAGMYLEDRNFFAGISAPYLFNNAQDFISTGLLNVDPNFNHFYLTTGYRFDLNNITLTPTILAKAVSGSPLQADLNINMLFQEQIWGSIGVRSNTAIVGSIGYIFPKGIKLIYSYDVTAFAPSGHSLGSHEVSLGFGTAFYHKNQFQRRKYIRRNKRGIFKRKLK